MVKFNSMHQPLIRVCRAHMMLIGLIILQIIIFDSTKLITPDIVLLRWQATAIYAMNVVWIWYLARRHSTSARRLNQLLWWLIAADIALVSFQIYIQRGMASRSVALYAIPLISSSLFATRRAIFATAGLIAAAYTTTTVSYFVLNFNEGYKAELYAESGYYAAVALVMASMLWVIVRHKQNR